MTCVATLLDNFYLRLNHSSQPFEAWKFGSFKVLFTSLIIQSLVTLSFFCLLSLIFSVSFLVQNKVKSACEIVFFWDVINQTQILSLIFSQPSTATDFSVRLRWRFCSLHFSPIFLAALLLLLSWQASLTASIFISFGHLSSFFGFKMTFFWPSLWMDSCQELTDLCQ